MAHVDDVKVEERQFQHPGFLDIVESSKDPQKHYRFVRVDEHMLSNTKHTLLGYEPVKRGEVETLAAPSAKGGDNIVIGDVMLMACSKEDYEKRQVAKKRRQQQLFETNTQELRERAEKLGVKFVNDVDHNKETR